MFPREKETGVLNGSPSHSRASQTQLRRGVAVQPESKTRERVSRHVGARTAALKSRGSDEEKRKYERSLFWQRRCNVAHFLWIFSFINSQGGHLRDSHPRHGLLLFFFSRLSFFFQIVKSHACKYYLPMIHMWMLYVP